MAAELDPGTTYDDLDVIGVNKDVTEVDQVVIDVEHIVSIIDLPTKRP